MGNDAALRSCLVWLAVAIVVVGLCTHSFMKMTVTYFFGIAAIAGVLLPDWEFFDRDMSQWTRAVCVDEVTPDHVLRPESQRFRFYPMRTAIYTLVYAWFVQLVDLCNTIEAQLYSLLHMQHFTDCHSFSSTPPR